MPSLFFSKVIPGGNATIILHEPGSWEGKLGPVAARLMHPMHIQAEKVGAWRLRHEKLPFLEMMGGEFCVNATRSAAFLLAGMGRWQPFQLPVTSSAAAVHEQAFSKQADRETIWTGSVRVAGMPEPLSIRLCHDKRGLAH